MFVELFESQTSSIEIFSVLEGLMDLIFLSKCIFDFIKVHFPWGLENYWFLFLEIWWNWIDNQLIIQMCQNVKMLIWNFYWITYMEKIGISDTT